MQEEKSTEEGERLIAARARRSFVEPDASPGGVVAMFDSSSDQTPNELLVVAKDGRMQPAKSLYEYVQQNVVELCAAWISRSEGGAEPYWDDAHEIYGKPFGGPACALQSHITPAWARHIVEARRREERAARALRVCARRSILPAECVGVIEAFVLLPAREAVPCRREQLPAFMLRACEQYEHDSAGGDLCLAHMKSGSVGGVEVWRGRLYGPTRCVSWTIFPRELLDKFRRAPESFGRATAPPWRWNGLRAEGWALVSEREDRATFVRGWTALVAPKLVDGCQAKGNYLEAPYAWPEGTSADETRDEVWDARGGSPVVPAWIASEELKSALEKSYTRAARLLGYGR